VAKEQPYIDEIYCPECGSCGEVGCCGIRCLYVVSQKDDLVVALLRVARAAKAYKEYPPNWKQGIVQERIAIWKEYCDALKEVEHLL